MVLMKRDTVYKGLVGAFGACLLLAGCSSAQKPAVLGPVGGSATGTASTSSPATPTGATGSTSSSASSAASSSSAAPAPTSVASSNGEWSYSASVPGDADIAAALKAFQNYAAISYQMAIKVQYDRNLVTYTDGNVLSLANNFVTQERQDNLISRGPEIVKVTGVTKDGGTPPIVTITTCTDDSKLPMYSSYGPRKGQILALAPKTPTPDIYKVHRGADGKWRVNAVTPETTPCSV